MVLSGPVLMYIHAYIRTVGPPISEHSGTYQILLKCVSFINQVCGWSIILYLQYALSIHCTVNIISLTSLKITQAFCCLLGFLYIHNSIWITKGLDNGDSDNRGSTVLDILVY